MVRLTSPAKNSSLLGSNSGPLELRVTNAPLAGQIVKLQGNKCTIGSGRNCTLRLQARRVEPVHCLILRGEQGTVIRRWSTNTRLNGAAFTDALLQPGDRLTVGPIVLEVVATGQALEDAQQAVQQLLGQPADSSSSKTFAEDQAALEEKLAEITQREKTLSELEEVLRQEQSAWEAEHSARQAELDDLKHQLGNAQQLQLDLPILAENQQQQEAQLKRKEGELESQQEQLRIAHEVFEKKRLSQENALVKRRRELDEQADALHLEQEKLEAERQQFTDQQKSTEEAFELSETELNQRQMAMEEKLKRSTGEEHASDADLQQREEQWQAAQAAWASEKSVWETTCQQTSDELLKKEQELHEQQEALRSERETWESERREAQDKMAERQSALQELNDTLTAKQATLEEERSQWEQELARQTAQINEQRAQIDEQRALLAERERELEEAKSALPERTETAQPESDSFEPIESPRSLHTELKTPTPSDDSFSGMEEEACDTPAFEPTASIADMLSHFKEEVSRANQKSEQQLESNEEAANAENSVLGVCDFSEEPTELEAEAGWSASGLDSTAESDPEEETSQQRPSLVEQLFGDSEKQPVCDHSQQGDAESEAEEDQAFEPISNPFNHSEDSPSAQQQKYEEDAEPEFEEPAVASPADNSGLMDRLRAMADWDEEEDGEDQPRGFGQHQAAPTPFEAAKESSTSGGSGHAGEDDEESIEDYMAKMMMRIRGVQGHSTQSVPTAPQKKHSPAKPEPKPVEKPVEEVTLEQQAQPQKPFEMAPRKAPVELTSNLAAMRELANSSAREAIDLSVRNRWAQAAVGKFSVAGMALVAAGFLFYWSRDPFSIGFLGGGVASLVAVFWGLQGAMIHIGVRRAKGLPTHSSDEPRQLLEPQHVVSENRMAATDFPEQAQENVTELSGEAREPKTEPHAEQPAENPNLDTFSSEEKF